jgi:membrane protein YqaA with SNARE-associated domain
VIINYDESVIQMQADVMTRRARTIALVLMSFGAATSVVATWLLLRIGWLWARHPDSAVPVLLLATIVGGLCGWAIGDARAATLRLSAQLALCQLQIERNTRAAVPRAATAR